MSFKLVKRLLLVGPFLDPFCKLQDLAIARQRTNTSGRASLAFLQFQSCECRVMLLPQALALVRASESSQMEAAWLQ